MGAKLSLQDIKTGDMILMGVNNYFGKTVKLTTQSSITHAGVLINCNELTSSQLNQLDIINYDSKFSIYMIQCDFGINFKSTFEILPINQLDFLSLHPDVNNLHVRYLKKSITSSQIDELIKIYLENKTTISNVSFINVMNILLFNYGIRLPQLIKTTPSFVCSSFIAYVYNRLEILKCEHWFLISPKMLTLSSKKTDYGNTDIFSEPKLIGMTM
jgi:hypothetical protein